ncbi:hypothetical protein [Streptomyces sp. NPDC093707]|uniref:hypothetical protein n=1 Tax=Streptomyces sp. NPDC093707 TaxID=3154984 RepID=UPI00344C82DA
MSSLLERFPKKAVPSVDLPVAAPATDAEVQSLTHVVSRSARERDGCLELLDALGLLRSALERRGLLDGEPSAKGRDEEQGEYGGAEPANV